MTSLPDPYLKAEMESLRKSPSPEAWDRIEGNLIRQKNHRIIFRMAAALFVLVSLTCSIWIWQKQGSKETPLAKTSSSSPIINQEEIVASAKSQPQSDISIRPAPPQIKIRSKKTKNSTVTPSIPKDQAIPPVVNNTIAANAPTRGQDNPGITQILSPKNDDGQPNLYALTANFARGNKITYSADDVNNRFLRKSLITMSDSLKKPEHNFQKVLDITYTLTHDGKAYGDLRQLKDDLLSFSFKDPDKDK